MIFDDFWALRPLRPLLYIDQTGLQRGYHFTLDKWNIIKTIVDTSTDKKWREFKVLYSKKNDKCKARTMANSRVVLWKWQVCLHVDYKSKIRCLSSETANVGNEYSKWSENFWNNPIQHRFSTLLPSENILTSPPIHQDSEHRRLHEAVHPIYGLFWKHGLAAKHRSLFL